MKKYYEIVDEEERFNQISEDTGFFESCIEDFTIESTIKNDAEREAFKNGRDYDIAKNAYDALVVTANAVNDTESYNRYFLQEAFCSEEFDKRFFAQQVMHNLGLYASKKEIGVKVIITLDLLTNGEYQMKQKFYPEGIIGKTAVVVYPKMISTKIKNPFNNSGVIIPAIIELE